MRQLLAVLIHWFPDRRCVFAGDGGYGTHALASFAAQHRRTSAWLSLFYAKAACTTRRRWSWARRMATSKKGDKRPGPQAVVAATESPDSTGGVVVRRRSPRG